MSDRSRVEAVWEEHTSSEFVTRDVDATMASMTDDPYVVHVPTGMGGRGRADVRQFYATWFVGKQPDDLEIESVSRTIDDAHVVDEMLVRFTHDTAVHWMLPAVAPTGRRVVVPVVAVVGLRSWLVDSEHIYWDQASVLEQVGLLSASGLPVLGAEQADQLDAAGASRLNALAGVPGA